MKVTQVFFKMALAISALAGLGSVQAQSAVDCTTDGNNIACGGAANAGAASVSINAGGVSISTDSSVQIGSGLALDRSTAVGHSTSALNESTAVGRNSISSNQSVAVGVSASAGGGTSAGGDVAVGVRATASGSNSLAIGTDAGAAAEGSAAIGYGSFADEANTVSVGAGSTPGVGPATRRITNLSAGINSTDAVNVQQLNTALSSVSAVDQLARDAAASAQFDATTALTGGAHDSVARTSAAAAGTAAAAAQADATTALTGGAHDSVARTSAAAAGTAAAAAGTAASAAHGRLDVVDTTLFNHEDRITILEAMPGGGVDQIARDSAGSAHQRIDKLDKKAMQGIAAALASTAAMPAGVDLAPGEIAMNIGLGSYSSQTSMAMGWAHRMKSDEPFIRNAVVRGAIAITGGRAAVSAGIGWKW